MAPMILSLVLSGVLTDSGCVQYAENARIAEHQVERLQLRLNGRDREIAIYERLTVQQSARIASTHVVVRNEVPGWAWITIGVLSGVIVTGGTVWAVERSLR